MLWCAELNLVAKALTGIGAYLAVLKNVCADWKALQYLVLYKLLNQLFKNY